MNRFALWMTKKQIQNLNGKFLRTELTRPIGYSEQEVAVFSGDNVIFLGQCTLWRTVIINESVTGDQKALDYVLLHEFTHKKQWWAYFIIPIAFFLLAGIIEISISLIAFFIYLVKLNVYGIAGSFLGILVGGLLISMFGIFSWIMELDADFHAIDVVSLTEYREIIKSLPKPRKLSLTHRIIGRFTHPPASFTIRCYELIRRRAH